MKNWSHCESQIGNGGGSKVIESRLRMANELENKEDNGRGLAESLYLAVAECVQKNVAANSVKKVESAAKEGREVRAKEGKREMWVVKKDLKGSVQKSKKKYGLFMNGEGPGFRKPNQC